MIDIAEKFVPEYANILNALVGATFIASKCDTEKTCEMAKYLLQHNTEFKFPVFYEMNNFFSEIWNAKKYSRIMKLHYTVDFTLAPDQLYYKAYIQTLEIRRIKFKMNHSKRNQRFF